MAHYTGTAGDKKDVCDEAFTEHLHSGIKFVTAAERHAGKSKAILANRHQVYEAAKAAHPERWNGRATRDWSDVDIVYLNPDKAVDENESIRQELLISTPA